MPTFKDLKTSQLSLTKGVYEKDIEEYIKNNTSALGLGNDIECLTVQKRQRNGILDMVLRAVNSEERYVVELQLGELNPDHIIRTIEYWETERKANPDYQYTAVLIAEKISRYFPVLSLLQKAVPIIAIQMVAAQMENNECGLLFTKVLDYIPLESYDENNEEANEEYWLKYRTNKDILNVINHIQTIATEICQGAKLQMYYRKTFIGIRDLNNVDFFIKFIPNKSKIHCWTQIFNSKTKSEIVQKIIDQSEILVDVKGGIDIKPKALEGTKDIEALKQLFQESYRLACEN